MAEPILVVGAGPVGLTMAAELARYGVPVRIIDKAPAPSDKSKALVLWSRSLELIDRMGCGEDFVAAGLRVRAVNIAHGSSRIASVAFDALPTPHAYALMIPQNETERLMNRHLETLGVQVARSVTLAGFSPGPASIAARLHHADGREEQVTTPWLIGCDGAHSTIRHTLGLAFEGDTLASEWMLADVMLDGVDGDQTEMTMWWHEDGILVFFPISPGRYRVVGDLGAPAEGAPRDPTLAEVQALIDRRGPGGIMARDPIWLSTFRINERKIKDYRAGRVFLAGDAAHVHSPAGGQGMNTGMQDVMNLAWKLALVCRGEAHGDVLLDSFSTERSPVGQQVLKTTGRLTRVGTLHGTFLQTLRNHMASLLAGLAPVRRGISEEMTELSIGYPQSPLSGPSAKGPAPGSRAPVHAGEIPVGAGTAPRFALFGAGTEAATLGQRYPTLLETGLRAPFAEGVLTLVRPDGYVAMAATETAAVVAYLDRFVGVAPA